MASGNMRDYLDDRGEISKEITGNDIEEVKFYTLVIDVTSRFLPKTLTSSDIRCFRKACGGRIKTAYWGPDDEIHWYCPECESEGVIRNWKGTKWDNRVYRK